MKKETQKRIKYYKHLLPGLKSKVFAAATMALVATVTAVSATYAWVTLSASPEVTSIDTTVTANGSLEIALANGTGEAPGKSGAGDSTGAGTSLTTANIKWGNQVNLNDPSYGLDKVTLRPAAKNGTTGLLTNPLYGVGYGEDGRVSETLTEDDFAYAYYDATADSGNGKFLVDTNGSHLGVRAISTVQWENTEGTAKITELLKKANTSWNLAKTNYIKIVDRSEEKGEAYISSLEGLMQTYSQQIVLEGCNPSDVEVDGAHVTNLYNMMQDVFDNVMTPMGESYVQLANLLQLFYDGSESAGYTVDTLVDASRAGSLPSYIADGIPNFANFATDYALLRDTYLKGSELGTFNDLTDSQKKLSLAYWAYQASRQKEIHWSDLNSIVNYVCEVNSVTLDGYTISEIKADKFNKGMAVYRNSDDLKGLIQKGEIVRLEQYLGQYMDTTVTVRLTMDVAIVHLDNSPFTAKSLTTAANPINGNTDASLLSQDTDTVKSKYTGSIKGDTATAMDTYALALDLWLRTNGGANADAAATTTIREKTDTNEDGSTVTSTITTVTQPEKAYLTLEGTVLYKTVNVQKTFSQNKFTYDVYTATATLGGELKSSDVYLRNGTYYYFGSDGNLTNFEEALKAANNGALPDDLSYTPQMIQQEVVSGYEGANRIWNDEQMAAFASDATSTTQGGGSCYIFYADNEADQKRFLQLLDSMRVVFVDGGGRQIGSARMDTTNYYAENGKVTVPLKLDTSSAIKLGTDESGNTIYGLMALTKNAATRVTALVYLDGTKLTNEMVLANGDIQGALNVQFSTYNASKVTETTTDASGNTSTDTSYKHGTDNEAVTDESIMGDTVSVSAKVDQTEFSGDALPVSTGVHITVAGVEPKSVQVKFIRAISSTQGVLQDAIDLTKNGDAWDGTLTLDKPGNYKLHSAWVDGVEYALNGGQEISVTVPGYTVSSIGCDALPAGSRQATIMTADSSVSAKMTLGFSSSYAVPSKLIGIFMSEDGRQVNVPFKLDGGVWTGTATFATSGNYTMKYVEIDGDQYELNESLQPTLQILLGLRAEVSVSASSETKALLKSIYEDATPTNFLLDTGRLGGPVTLTTSVKLYDNSGSELPALTGAKLRYGRAGSSLQAQGLDCDLTWNSSTQSYEGAFQIDKAGSFSFKQVEIDLSGKTSKITASTSASKIQAIPPDDASYFGNYTESYQFSPSKAGSIVIGIAYSSAATKVEGTLTNGSETQTVEGMMGTEAENQGDKSVNKWVFTLPNEGNWTLTGITMYGVYYQNKLVGDEGVTVDLTKENITAKYVKTLYTTLSGTSQSFMGCFMDDHELTDMTVTIADFEGKPILNHTISDVKVTYQLDASQVGMDSDYGYTSDNLDSVSVSGSGSLQNGSETVFAISGMNFRQAGPYSNPKVSFAVDNETIIANVVGSSGAKLSYMVDGHASDTYPKYDVKWSTPAVTITEVSPAQDQTIQVNAGNGGTDRWVNTANYIEDHYAYLGMQATGSGLSISYIMPQLTMKLEGAGTFTSATLRMPTSDKNNSSYKECAEVLFTFEPTSENTDTYTQTAAIGYVTSSHRSSVNTTVKTIEMVYDNATFTLYLTDPIQIVTASAPRPQLTYTIADRYQGKIDLPEDILKKDGRKETIKLADLTNERYRVVEDFETSNARTQTDQKTETIKVYRKYTSCSKTYYETWTKTVVTTTYNTELYTRDHIMKPTGYRLQKAQFTGTSGSEIAQWYWTLENKAQKVDYVEYKDYKLGQSLYLDACYFRAILQVEEESGTTTATWTKPVKVIETTYTDHKDGLTTLPDDVPLANSIDTASPEDSVVEEWPEGQENPNA